MDSIYYLFVCLFVCLFQLNIPHILISNNENYFQSAKGLRSGSSGSPQDPPPQNMQTSFVPQSGGQCDQGEVWVGPPYLVCPLPDGLARWQRCPHPARLPAAGGEQGPGAGREGFSSEKVQGKLCG